MSLVVHYWADLQSVHGLRCNGNITRTRNVSEYMPVLAACIVIITEIKQLRQLYLRRSEQVGSDKVEGALSFIAVGRSADELERR